MNNRPHLAGNSNKGFSLLELLLVLVIVLMLFSSAVFEFTSMNRGASLLEGADRLESLFRFARNEAERTGKKVRIRFGPSESASPTGSTSVLENTNADESFPVLEWEPTPIESPGQFKTLPNASHFTADITELVKIESVRLAGLDAQFSSLFGASLKSNKEQNGDFSIDALDDLPTLYFFPDGSCDSAEIQLTDINPENLNKKIVELVGYTGTVRHRLIEIFPDQPDKQDETNIVDESSAPLGQAEPAP